MSEQPTHHAKPVILSFRAFCVKCLTLTYMRQVDPVNNPELVACEDSGHRQTLGRSNDGVPGNADFLKDSLTYRKIGAIRGWRV